MFNSIDMEKAKADMLAGEGASFTFAEGTGNSKAAQMLKVLEALTEEGPSEEQLILDPNDPVCIEHGCFKMAPRGYAEMATFNAVTGAAEELPKFRYVKLNQETGKYEDFIPPARG